MRIAITDPWWPCKQMFAHQVNSFELIDVKDHCKEERNSLSPKRSSNRNDSHWTHLDERTKHFVVKVLCDVITVRERSERLLLFLLSFSKERKAQHMNRSSFWLSLSLCLDVILQWRNAQHVRRFLVVVRSRWWSRRFASERRISLRRTERSNQRPEESSNSVQSMWKSLSEMRLRIGIQVSSTMFAAVRSPSSDHRRDLWAERWWMSIENRFDRADLEKRRWWWDTRDSLVLVTNVETSERRGASLPRRTIYFDRFHWSRTRSKNGTSPFSNRFKTFGFNCISNRSPASP